MRTRSNFKAGKLGAALSSSRLDSFLVQISDAALRVRPDAATPLIDEWLAKLAPLIEVDRISLWELIEDGKTLHRRHSYTRAGCDSPPDVTPSSCFAWLMEQNRRGEIVVWSRLPDDIPQTAVAEREYVQSCGVKSLLSIPVSAQSILCVLAFTSLRKFRLWPDADVQKLRLVAMTLAGLVVRQRAEASVRESEARNRAILMAVPDLMLVLSPEGVYLDYHCRDDSDLVAPPEQFLGRRLEDMVPGEVAGAFREAVRSASNAAGMVQFEYSLCIKGEAREYEARMVRREDHAVVCIVRNITPRNRAARRLRESEERFRGAFEHSAIGIALVAPDGSWMQTNAAVCKILGYSEAELRSVNFQALTHPEDLASDLLQYHRALNGEIDHYEMEKRYIHKDGRIIPAFLTVSIVRDEHRRPLYFVSQVQDLTERKRAQLEIERLRNDLVHAGRLALTGQLTASLAHQLMQPIAAAQLNAETLQRWLAAAQRSSTEVERALDDILMSCTEAADIVNNVRSLLRKQPRPRQRVNVNRLIEEVIEVARYGLLLRKVKLTTRLEGELPETIGNPIELQQVILNLLLNGAEALQAVSHGRELVITTSRKDQGIEIAVHDGGIGVDAAALERMFEPFFTTKPDGMGMGLASCSDIIHAHGGRIWAEPNPVGGLTVRCELPLGLLP